MMLFGDVQEPVNANLCETLGIVLWASMCPKTAESACPFVVTENLIGV
jgi:hypothetical protein